MKPPPNDDRASLTLRFEGRELAAQPGDTVAAALLREGVRVFSRSPKYHRPRGPYCLRGTCARCHMRVGGEASVPTCVTPVTDGLEVERQSALGSAETDLLRAIDYLYPEGLDHHHLMTRFRALNVAAQALARRLAGFSRLPEPVPMPPASEAETWPLLIVGGGASGLAAARAAARAGLEPLLVETSGELAPRVADGAAPAGVTAEWARAAEEETIRGGRLLRGAMLVALYDHGERRVGLLRTREGLRLLWLDRVVLATGDLERPPAFEGNDLPGVFGARALLRLVRGHGVAPGSVAVVTGVSAEVPALTRALEASGVRVAAHAAGPVVRARGRQVLEAVELEDPRRPRLVECDLLAVAGATASASELAAQVGAELSFDEARPGFPVRVDARGRTTVPWLWAIGRVTGADETADALDARAAAIAADLARGPQATTREAR